MACLSTATLMEFKDYYKILEVPRDASQDGSDGRDPSLAGATRAIISIAAEASDFDRARTSL